MSSFFITAPTLLDDDIKGSKFGLLNSSIGVGIQIIYILHSLVSSILKVKFKLSLTANIESSLISRVLSLFFSNSSIRFRLISNPITLYFFANSTAKGRPTYPSPIMLF